MKKRLQTVLAHAGVASRRSAVDIIESGDVKIDGRVVKERGLKIDPTEHSITVRGKLLKREETKFYFLFNKPKNVISTSTDTHDRAKVIDFFKGIKARLYPVGRLDKNTTGILIMTNDGDLAHKLAHPRYEVEKEYLVTVDKLVRAEEIKRLREGVQLEGKLTSPCYVAFKKNTRRGPVYKVILHEGRKRQVRSMFEVVGVKVRELKRSRYAGLKLGTLKEGKFRELTVPEVKRLKKI